VQLTELRNFVTAKPVPQELGMQRMQRQNALAKIFLAKLIVDLVEFGRNLGKIKVKLGKKWIDLGKIKILHPQKHSISYGYGHSLTIEAGKSWTCSVNQQVHTCLKNFCKTMLVRWLRCAYESCYFLLFFPFFFLSAVSNLWVHVRLAREVVSHGHSVNTKYAKTICDSENTVFFWCDILWNLLK